MRTLTIAIAVITAGVLGLLWAAQHNVSGTWQFEVNTDAGSGSPTFEFRQEGSKLTGKYIGMAGEAPIAGALEGNRIAWEFKVSLGADPVLVKYQGTLESATAMKGTAEYPGLGSATWTAKKQ